MPLYDATGKEIPGAMTADEVSAKVTEATDAAKAEAETARQALETEAAAAKTLLDETNAKLAGMSDKDKNFSAVRKLADDQAKTIADLNSKIDSAVKGVLDTVTARTREAMIKSLADGDADLEAKIKVQYERLIKLEPTIDDATIAKVAADAYRLSTENVKPSVLNRVISSKPSGAIPRGDSTVAPELAEAGAAFGLTPEDIKKYSK